MKCAVVLLLLLVSPAYAWQPPSGGPSRMAKRVLDTLPDPKSVHIPSDIVERSRKGAAVALPAPVDSGVSRGPSPVGCWEVQVTALSDADRARDLAAQESSRLGVPTHVVTENGLAKVRAGEDCLSYDDATRLRDRVRDSGYPGAFVIRRIAGSGS
jgi:hypothetical protein